MPSEAVSQAAFLLASHSAPGPLVVVQTQTIFKVDLRVCLFLTSVPECKSVHPVYFPTAQKVCL